jgi:hypothetical protein
MNEFQNAHETGKLIRYREQAARTNEITAALDAGLFAVVGTAPAYCPFTDATTGNATHLLATFDTREAAEARAAEYNENDTEVFCEVFPRLPRPTRPALDFADIPF